MYICADELGLLCCTMHLQSGLSYVKVWALLTQLHSTHSSVCFYVFCHQDEIVFVRGCFRVTEYQHATLEEHSSVSPMNLQHKEQQCFFVCFVCLFLGVFCWVLFLDFGFMNINQHLVELFQSTVFKPQRLVEITVFSYGRG